MHFYVVKSKTLKLCFIAIMLAVVGCINFFNSGGVLADVFFYKNTRKIPIYCVERDDKQVALTFDAAWGSDKTQNILDILKENEITATFFLVGMWVDKNEELVKMIDEQGIEIGTHSNTHPDLTKLDKTQMELELSVSAKKIENITGKKVNIFRAPYGAYNNTLIETADSLGIKTIQWDVDTLDWKGINASQINSNVFKKVKSGSIILCHNNSDHIVDALPSLILGLKSRGYSFVGVNSLIFHNDFSIDSTGKQIKN